MTPWVLVLAIIYVIISVFIGILDLASMYAQTQELNSTPAGDIGEYIEPKHITGIHNIVFLPSIIVILCGVGLSKLTD